jgi:hypothetical protein
VAYVVQYGELAHAMDGLDRRARSLGVFMTIFQLTVGAA